MSPFFGIEPVLYSKDVRSILRMTFKHITYQVFTSQGDLVVGNNVTGHLCIKKPFPGMARTIYGDHQRFLDTYYKPHPGTKKIQLCTV